MTTPNDSAPIPASLRAAKIIVPLLLVEEGEDFPSVEEAAALIEQHAHLRECREALDELIQAVDLCTPDAPDPVHGSVMHKAKAALRLLNE